MKTEGILVDVHKRDMFPAEIIFENGIISKITRLESATKQYILPGLIDAHIHIESSMLTPGAFASAAVKHGTTGVISDPHEIANVLGMQGVDFMLNDAKRVPVNFWFGAPSCVPATDFESNGARLDVQELNELLSRKEIRYLSEMMNYPGVINGDKSVLEKIRIAQKFNKIIDGHAPGLSGAGLEKYVSAGISTDHECSTIGEAKEKIGLGMMILIREGSAARNLEALKDLFNSYPEMLMLCSDDLHPEMLWRGHINKLVAKLVKEGYNIFDVIRSCTVNPVKHYGLDAGLLIPGQKADFIVVDDPLEMNALETWINGKKVFDRGEVLFKYSGYDPVNKWFCTEIDKDSLLVTGTGGKVKIIRAFDGELLTKSMTKITKEDIPVETNLEGDILKIVVKDRYQNAPPVVGFINGFGLKNGAFASSVAHDSHNIICIGTNDEDIACAVNEIVKMKGGLSVSSGGQITSMKLDIAGIMTNRSCEETADEYLKLSDIVKSMGCTMNAPFMTLSFMALLVIPELKIGDKGLFDGNKFCLTSLISD